MFFRDYCLICVWWRRTFFTFQNGEQLSTATFLCPASTLFRVIMEQVPVKVSVPMTSRSGRCRSPTIIANNNMTCTQRDLGEKLGNEMPEVYEPDLPSRSSLSPVTWLHFHNIRGHLWILRYLQEVHSNISTNNTILDALTISTVMNFQDWSRHIDHDVRSSEKC